MPPKSKAAAAKEVARAQVEYNNARKARLDAARYEAPTSNGTVKDVVADFPIFCSFEAGGLAVDISFAAPARASTWSDEIGAEVLRLAEANMKDIYEAAPGWGWKPNKKKAELFDPEMRYLLCRDRKDGVLVAYAGFRFLMEDDFDVLYVYELQLAPVAQRKGLGKHLMQFMELIARKNAMQWVMLTVHKNNVSAMRFYMDKMKYTIDETSPSTAGEEAGHEILSKCIDPAARKRIDDIVTAFAEKRVPDCLVKPAAVAAAAGASTAAAGAGAKASAK